MICTLGDLLLDVIVRLDGPMQEDTDTYGRTRVGPGGQAANVAAWAAALGARARFVGKRARDVAGRVLAEELEHRRVEVAGPEVEAGTGTVVSVATPEGRRTMLTDRGAAATFSPEELRSDWLEGCSWLHVSGYSLAASPLRETAAESARIARRTGASLSVDLASTGAIEAGGVEEFRRTLAELAPELVFANEAEAELVGPTGADTIVVKLGARGCLVRTHGEEERHPAAPTEVVDTTGAGDAFAAGFLVGGAQLALAAAARCVGQMGAFPQRAHG